MGGRAFLSLKTPSEILQHRAANLFACCTPPYGLINEPVTPWHAFARLKQRKQVRKIPRGRHESDVTLIVGLHHVARRQCTDFLLEITEEVLVAQVHQRLLFEPGIFYSVVLDMFQQGTSDFRIGVTQPVSICIDTVEVVFGAEPEPTDPVFHRGDVNGDGQINISDGVTKLEFLFAGGSAPGCLDAADADDDGILGITGAVYIFNWLFAGGAEPPAPGPDTAECGPDPTDDPLVNADCEYLGC